MALATGPVREIIGRTIHWAALTLTLNAVWEIAQLPLYTLARGPDPLRITRYVGHCLAGDVWIATSLFLLAAVLWRDTDWPRHRPGRGGALVMIAGTGYTAVSEWRNVYVTHAWSYSGLMPTVGGIGLAPLLQWLVVPGLAIAFTRRHSG